MALWLGHRRENGGSAVTLGGLVGPGWVAFREEDGLGDDQADRVACNRQLKLTLSPIV
jgi:hypothetical protein